MKNFRNIKIYKFFKTTLAYKILITTLNFFERLHSVMVFYIKALIEATKDHFYDLKLGIDTWGFYDTKKQL